MPQAKKTKNQRDVCSEEKAQFGHFVSSIHHGCDVKNIDIREIIHERFDAQQSLWRGNGSLICKAYDREEQVFRALKIHRIERKKDIRREWKIRALLPEHPNLIPFHGVHGMHADDGTSLTALAMDYCDQGSLRSELHNLRQRSISNQVGSIVIYKQICSGIGAMHHSGVLHLDIKSDNVLGQGSTWKITDFGLSFHSDLDTEIGSEDPRSGTPQYMSPEQFEAAHPAELSVRTDIYSLGILLYEMLHPSGMPPFMGSYDYLRKKHTDDDPFMAKSWTPSQMAWFSTCLAKDPQDRFESVDTLLDCLDKAFPEGLGQDGREKDQAVAMARSILSEVDRSLESGDLEELVMLVAEAEKICPNMPEIQPLLIRLDHRSKKFENAMSSLHADVTNGRWQSALSHAQVALASNPKSHTAARLVQQLEERTKSVAEWTRSMEQAVWDGNEEKAMFFARKLDDLRSLE